MLSTLHHPRGVVYPIKIVSNLEKDPLGAASESTLHRQ